jgi:hypothetical protein
MHETNLAIARVAVGLCCLAACIATADGPDFGSGGSGGPDETGASVGTTGSEDGGGTTGETGGLKLDVAAGDGGGGPGCSKVDFVFMIDNSGSMFDEQQKLVAAFPSFIAAIEDTLEVTDFHILVIDTDGWDEVGNVHGCSPDPCCADVCAEYPFAICNDVACPAVDPDVGCDTRLGAGLVRDASGAKCALDGDRRYLVGDDSDLAGAFSCLAAVGVAGDSVEKPMDALRWVGSEELRSGCNAGFLRDDAILVTTFITDEEDRLLMSEGDPPDWHDALLAAKGGDPEAMVVLGIVGDELDSICDDGNFAQDAPRLRHFVDLFGPRGFVASICEPDFTPFFLETVSTIDTTCDEFEPEG